MSADALTCSPACLHSGRTRASFYSTRCSLSRLAQPAATRRRAGRSSRLQRCQCSLPAAKDSCFCVGASLHRRVGQLAGRRVTGYSTSHPLTVLWRFPKTSAGIANWCKASCRALTQHALSRVSVLLPLPYLNELCCALMLQDRGKLVDRRKHHVLEAAHPSGLSANKARHAHAVHAAALLVPGCKDPV